MILFSLWCCLFACLFLSVPVFLLGMPTLFGDVLCLLTSWFSCLSLLSAGITGVPIHPQILPQFVTLRRKVPEPNPFIIDTLETNSMALFYRNNLSHFSLNIPFPLLSFPYSHCACECYFSVFLICV